MKRLMLTAVAAVTLVLSGCSTTSGLSPEISKSGFDGATVVDVAPHGNQCLNLCTTLGAQWNSTRPDAANLRVGIYDPSKFYTIRGAQIRVGQDVIDLTPGQWITQLEVDPGVVARDSHKWFTVPLDLVRRIAASDDVWIRLSTNAGTVDDAIADNGKDSKALNALKRFLAKIDEVR
jgi:hypothetical protein